MIFYIQLSHYFDPIEVRPGVPTPPDPPTIPWMEHLQFILLWW